MTLPEANLETRLLRLEDEITAVHERNARVEGDKAWEVSGVRMLTLGVLTYVATLLVFCLLNAARVWLHALVPTCAYLVSVQSMPVVK